MIFANTEVRQLPEGESQPSSPLSVVAALWLSGAGVNDATFDSFTRSDSLKREAEGLRFLNRRT